MSLRILRTPHRSTNDGNGREHWFGREPYPIEKKRTGGRKTDEDYEYAKGNKEIKSAIKQGHPAVLLKFQS
jgi:hypothetical protein